MSRDADAGCGINLLSGKLFAGVAELLWDNEAKKSAPLKPEHHFSNDMTDKRDFKSCFELPRESYTKP